MRCTFARRLRQFLGEPQRRHGTITLERPGADPVTGLVLSISLQHGSVDLSGQSPGVRVT